MLCQDLAHKGHKSSNLQKLLNLEKLPIWEDLGKTQNKLSLELDAPHLSVRQSLELSFCSFTCLVLSEGADQGRKPALVHQETKQQQTTLRNKIKLSNNSKNTHSERTKTKLRTKLRTNSAPNSASNSSGGIDRVQS